MRLRSRRFVVLAVAASMIALAIGFIPLAGEGAGRLAFGWWSYLARVVPQVTVSPDGMATAAVCLVLLTVGMHRLLRGFSVEVRRANAPPGTPVPPSPWRFRATAALLALVLVMFVAGIAATGVVHQTGWLLTSKRPLTRYGLDSRHAFRWGGSSTNHLKLTGLAIQSTLDFTDPKYDAEGRDIQSWQTKILGGLPVTTGSPLHRDVRWDDPRNSAYFKGVVLTYLNPGVDGPIRDPKGYALSHYAGNMYVFGPGWERTLGELTRDGANTIVAGEAAGAFKPWGDPTNLRDPLDGMSTATTGFGGPEGNGANMLFLDGSVRFLGARTDRTVLQRLSHAVAPDPAARD